MQSTLVLNATYEPLSVVSAHRALTLIISGKATSIDDSDVTFRSARGSISVPHVIRLNEMVKRTNRKNTNVPFSRRGVLARDGFRCVYCSEKANTIDHVIPRMLGGISSYENCVAACGTCNRKKGHKTLDALGWSLNKKPTQPMWYVIILGRCASNSDARNSWLQHIAMWDSSITITH